MVVLTFVWILAHYRCDGLETYIELVLCRDGARPRGAEATPAVQDGDGGAVGVGSEEVGQGRNIEGTESQARSGLLRAKAKGRRTGFKWGWSPWTERGIVLSRDCIIKREGDLRIQEVSIVEDMWALEAANDVVQSRTIGQGRRRRGQRCIRLDDVGDWVSNGAENVGKHMPVSRYVATQSVFLGGGHEDR